MDDLISRQAAIDAIKEFCRGAKEWKDEQEERSDIWHRADSAIASALEIGLRIKKIPSTQPEIIRCRNCKHYYFADNRIPQEQRFTCDLDGDRWTADSYCSFAERREE